MKSASQLLALNHARRQFGLRSLLAATAVLAVLFAVGKWIGLAWSLGTLWVGLLVAAHVFGNAWGSKLRGEAARRPYDEGPAGAPTDRERLAAVRHAPSTRLGERIGISRVMLGATAGGAVVGMFVGTVLLMALVPGMNALHFLIGSISSGVLGGFFGFLTSSFSEVALRAWFQASTHERLNRPPRRRSISWWRKIAQLLHR